MSIEQLVETYHEGHKSRINQILHVIGIVLATLGFLALLWMIPSGLIKSWLGDHPFANWATVYAVLMIIYFGSESFTLTFAGGLFFQGGLFAIDFFETQSYLPFEWVVAGLLASGFIFIFLGHLIQGNIREFKRDLIYFPITPLWIFRFIYRWFGISF